MVSPVTRCKACHGRKTIPKIGGMGMKDCPACMGVGSTKEPEKVKEEVEQETSSFEHPRYKTTTSMNMGEIEQQTIVKKEVHTDGNSKRDHSLDKRKKKN